MKKVLLLTACVNPDGMAYTSLQDPSSRCAQYISALDWYLSFTNFQIVFCENSNFVLPNKYSEAINCGRLEYLSFNGNETIDKTRGKGLGEALIIKHALEHSSFLKNADLILKMTGRQILENINFVVDHSNEKHCIYANTTKQNLSIMASYSQFFICPKQFLFDFLSGINKLNDSHFYYFEHLLYDSSKKWVNEGKGNMKNFWMPLLICGTSGSVNKILETPKFPWIKSVAKFILHKLGIYRKDLSKIFSDDEIKRLRDL